MKYPCLVRKKDCRTHVLAEIEQEGLNEYGEPLGAVVFEGLCNYQDSAKAILTEEKKLVQVAGTALFPGDIAPGVPVVSSGTVVVHGVKRRIAQGMKARNPDGTVNFCRLEVV